MRADTRSAIPDVGSSSSASFRDPGGIIAGLLPKDVNLKVSALDDMSDEQLMRKLAALTEMARPLLARITDGAHVEPQRNPEPVDAEYVDISRH
jgi:hypothetical protein